MPLRPIQYSFSIIWIMTQVIFNIISPYITLLQFRSYGSSIDDHQFPYLHPSENPDCQFRVSERESYYKRFQYQQRFPIDREPSIEIRAILIPCPGLSEKTFEEREKININNNETLIEYLETYNREEIRNCRQKLLITLKLNNIGKTRTEEEYIVVSHALDPITMQKSRLQNPYVIKVRQESVLQLYGMKFEKVVNAEAKEQIINNQHVNYTGCDDGLENPTCGLTYENGNPVPFSQGFCCSCNSEINSSRQFREESNKSAGNFSFKIKTKDKKMTNKSNKRSTFYNAYKDSFDEPELSAAAQTDQIERMKKGYLVYNSRQLKQSNIVNNVSTVDNEDISLDNDNVKINLSKKGITINNADIIDITAGNADNKIENVDLYGRNIKRNIQKKLVTKSDLAKDDSIENTTSLLIRSILFSPRMQTKGKIEPYIDIIQDQAIRESRNLNANKSRVPFDSKTYIDESRVTLNDLTLKNHEDRIDDISKRGRINLMDELAELEKTYDTLKKMKKNKRRNRSTRNVELPIKNNQFIKNTKKRENSKDERTNRERTKNCFYLRRNNKEIRKNKNKNKKKNKEKSNSKRSICLLAASRLKQFPRRFVGTFKKIYEDQSCDIEVPRKMKFTGYFTTENISINSITTTTTTTTTTTMTTTTMTTTATITTTTTTTTTTISNESETNNVHSVLSSNSTVNKSTSSSFNSYENDVFALLTRLLITDEDIPINQNKKINMINNHLHKSNPMVINKQLNSSNNEGETHNKLFIFAQRNSNITVLIDRSPRSLKSFEKFSLKGEENKSKIKRQGKGSQKENNNDPEKNLIWNGSSTSLNEKNLTKIRDYPSKVKNDTSKTIQIFVDEPFDLHEDKYLNSTVDINSTDNPFLTNENIRQNNIDKNIEEKFDRISETLKDSSNEAKNCSNKYKMKINKKKKEVFKDISGEGVENLIDNKIKKKLNVVNNFNKGELIKNVREKMVNFKSPAEKCRNTNVEVLKDNTLSLDKVIPSNKSSFSLNPVNGVEKSTERAQESRYRTNVQPSGWKARQISDLIISRSRLNSTTVGNPRRNAVSYPDLDDAKIVVFRKINSSGDTNFPLIYQTNDHQNKNVFTNQQYNIIHEFHRSNITDDNKDEKSSITKSVKNNPKNPSEIIFYDYTFDGDDDDDDDNDDNEYSHDQMERTVRRLLSIDHSNKNLNVKPSFEYLDSQNFEYEDYVDQPTDSTNEKDRNDSSDKMIDQDTETSSKQQISRSDELYNNVKSDKSMINADKYIKHMAGVIADRGNSRSKSEKHKNSKKELKIVKKNVHDSPYYPQRDYNLNFDSRRPNDIRKIRTNFDFNLEDANDELNLNQNENLKFDDEVSSLANPSKTYQTENDMKYDDRSRSFLKSSRSSSLESLENDSNDRKQIEFDVNGRKNEDIDISVNGNIHVEGGINGRPISIAFVAVPDVESNVDTINNDSYFSNQDLTSNEANDQNDSPFNNIESNVLSKDEDRSDQFFINNDNDQQFNEINKKSIYSPLESKDHFYDDNYKLEKLRNNPEKPNQRLFIYDPKNAIFNENLESPIDEENDNYLDDTDDYSEMNLAREKKEADDFQDNDLKCDEKLSNDNVTSIKLIPEKPYDNIPSYLKNNFSDNLEINSYNQNYENLYLPLFNSSVSNENNSIILYDNLTNNINFVDQTGPIFSVVFDTTTVVSIENLQDKGEISIDTTAISKITESKAFTRPKKPPVELLIPDVPVTFEKEITNTAKVIEQNGKKTNGNYTTIPTTIQDTCFRMKVTHKEWNNNKSTIDVPRIINDEAYTTSTAITTSTTIAKKVNQLTSLWKNENSKIRGKNTLATSDFIEKLQPLLSSSDINSEKLKNQMNESQMRFKHVVIVPEDTYVSNITNSKAKCDKIIGKKDTRKSIIPALLSSVNGTLGNSTFPLVESRSSTIKEKKTTKDTLHDSTSKLLSSIKANSTGPFYQTSLNSNMKEQQHRNCDESSKSSVKRSHLKDRKNNDKSFLFYSRQKQSRHFPQLLLKTRVSNDINSKLLSKKKELFLERDKRNKRKANTKNSNNSRSSREVIKPKTLIGRLSNVKREIKEKNSHVKSTDKANFEMLLKTHEPKDTKCVSKKKRLDVRNSKDSRFPGKVIERELSIGGDLSNVKREIEIGKSHVKSTDKARFPDLHKRKIEKRKKKMDIEEEIKKLTDIRRKKKNKKKKKKKKKEKTKSPENTLDIPEAKSKWKLTKRNLLSIQDNKEMGESKVSKMRREEMKKESESTLIGTDAKQVRGGQDCSNRDQSLDVDESKYSASAHCLRFSDLWYSVYRLEEPILNHAVSLQLYERRSLPDGTTRWEDLTPSMIRLDTFSRRYISNDDTLALTYRAKREVSKEFPVTLDIKKDRLLIPSSISTIKDFKINQSKDVFEEYLIVRASEISKDGNECDKIGVGFKAFVEQPNRCRRLKGTCLKNQPLSYWKHDREAREAGRAGCYFLSNFASVPSEAIKYNVSGSGSGEFLALEYHSPHVSAIDIEVRNDYNSVPSAGPFGRITQIYVDSISLIHTIVMIVIRNVGSTPSVYRTRIVNCPQGLPASWSNVKSLVQIILPRQNRRVVFDLYGKLPFNEFQCTVELLNRVAKTVARRRMKVRKMDRCLCVWHCLCACVTIADGCRPMSMTHYRAAGFQPPVPNVPMRSSFDGSFFDVILLLLSIVALLIFMGISKWIIGIYMPEVSRWGLDTLIETTKMNEYFEEELKCRCIVFDESGFPIHPDSGSRSIRICSRKTEFLLNAIFFLIYPIAVCWYQSKKILKKRLRRYSLDESRACLSSDKDESENLVTVSTYGDSRNSKMEADDTNYVMNELKKSQESLQEYNRYKRYRCYMEGKDRNRNN